jgi:hypothetical protein
MIALLIQVIESLDQNLLWLDDTDRFNSKLIMLSLLSKENGIIEFVLSEAFSACGALPFVFDISDCFLSVFSQCEDASWACFDQFFSLRKGLDAGEYRWLTSAPEISFWISTCGLSLYQAVATGLHLAWTLPLFLEQ